MQRDSKISSRNKVAALKKYLTADISIRVYWLHTEMPICAQQDGYCFQISVLFTPPKKCVSKDCTCGNSLE